MSPTLRILRPHQWSKNLLLVVPMAFAHRLSEPDLWIAISQAFLSFSLLASAVYIMNDADDVESDRQHPSKKRRPFASGELPLSRAPLLCAGVALAGYLISIGLPLPFTLSLILYSCLNVLYSRRVKRIPGADILFLTVMFLIRIYAGGFAVRVPVSGWLTSVAFFFFLSLAMIKRAQELIAVPAETPGASNARGYGTTDLLWLRRAGPGSALCSVALLAGYILEGEMVNSYEKPGLLWLLPPLVGSWMFRVWKLTQNGKMKDDPVAFALRDAWSYAAGLATVMIVQFAYLGGFPSL